MYNKYLARTHLIIIKNSTEFSILCEVIVIVCLALSSDRLEG